MNQPPISALPCLSSKAAHCRTAAYWNAAMPRYWSSSTTMPFKATLSLNSGSYSLITIQKQMVMAYPSPHPHWYKYLRELPLPKLIKCSIPFAYHRRWIHCGTELYSNAYLLHWTAYPEVNTTSFSLLLRHVIVNQTIATMWCSAVTLCKSRYESLFTL